MVAPAVSVSVLVLVGATATGKTAVGIEVARRLGGEVVSADSRAFFRSLDVVTAKPTVEERAGVPHHLIDFVPIDRGYDAMAFRRDVAGLVPEIASRGNVPLLVGGGTLYLSAVLRGIFEGPAKNARFRRSVAAETADALHRRLREVDPEAASGIHPNDRLRVVRALEVYETSGKPISRWQGEARPLPYDFVVFGLRRKRDDHRVAIEARVRRMIEGRLIDEVRWLRAEGLSEMAQAYRTIGIPAVVAHLEGRSTEAEMEEAIVRETWSLARRQSAWFRRDPEIVWLDATGRTAGDLAAEIVVRWRERIE